MLVLIPGRTGMPSGAAYCRGQSGSGIDGDGYDRCHEQNSALYCVCRCIPDGNGRNAIGWLMSNISHGGTTLFVCVSCRMQAADAAPSDRVRPGAQLLAAINAAPDEWREGLSVVPVECLSNCNRSCTVAVTAPGKWTYVVGALDPEHHAGDVLAFARLHQAHEAGLPVWRQRPEHVRKNTIARVPPLPLHLPEEVSQS